MIQFETVVSVNKDENGYHAYLTYTLDGQEWNFCGHGSAASGSIKNARIRAAHCKSMQEAIDKILVPVEYTIKTQASCQSVDKLRELYDMKNRRFAEHYGGSEQRMNTQRER